MPGQTWAFCTKKTCEIGKILCILTIDKLGKKVYNYSVEKKKRGNTYGKENDTRRNGTKT